MSDPANTRLVVAEITANTFCTSIDGRVISLVNGYDSRVVLINNCDIYIHNRCVE